MNSTATMVDVTFDANANASPEAHNQPKDNPDMSTPTTIRIDDTDYIRADSIPTQTNPDSPIRIVILQRGWVAVGRFTQTGEMCNLDGASTIRRWGTTKGLGQLVNGPLPSTVADPCGGQVTFHILAVVAMITCTEGSWT